MLDVTQDAQMVNGSLLEVRRCARCIMPENYPGVTLDADGVCSHCRYFETNWGPWVASAEKQTRSEAKLRRIFEAAKRKGKPYDALVGISGGKDSSYCLYLCREVYGLNVLTFTRDNGFVSDEATARIEQLVTAFKVPFQHHKVPMARELARIFLLKTGNFCAPCQLGTFNLATDIARKYDIPLVVLGSSSRTDGAPPKSLNPWDPWYFDRVLKGEPCREQVRKTGVFWNRLVGDGIAQVLRYRRIICLPEYVEWDERKISELFKRDFGIDFGREHSDCVADGVKDYLLRRKCGGSDPTIVKYSLLVRSGQMTRERALEQVGKDNKNPPAHGLDHFLELISITPQEFEAASNRSPAPYLRGMPQIFNALRRRIRRQAA